MGETKPAVRVLRMLEVAAIVFSVITGAISAFTLVWKGGEIAHTIATHEIRLSAIEQKGSPTIAEHIKLDDEREKWIKARIEKLEEIYKISLDMRSELARLSQKVDDLREATKDKK